MYLVQPLRQILLLAVMMMFSIANVIAEPGFQRLSAVGIHNRLAGKTVTDDAHWADHFQPAGILDSHELGEARRGSWVVERGELCLTRQVKRPGKECFEVWTKGDQVEYRRDGVAVMMGMIQ